MTFLLDHDVPEDITFSLNALGHRVIRLREVLPPEATDQQVLAHAFLEKSVGQDLLVCRFRRQHFTQADYPVAKRVERKGDILGDVVVQEEGHGGAICLATSRSISPRCSS